MKHKPVDSSRAMRMQDLKQLNDSVLSLALQPTAPDDNSEVIGGAFKFRNYFGGLSLHGGRFEELQDLKNCFELPAGISFNLVFEGNVDFVLAGTHHSLRKMPGHRMTCYAISAERPELMTRHMQRGNTVSKLNLFAERHWLEARCKSTQDKAQLQRFFFKHAKVTYWEASPQLLALANELINSAGAPASLCGGLREEAHAISLLSTCLDELQQQQHTAPATDNNALHGEQKTLKQQIDEQLSEPLSLSQLAARLNMSISTLQRRFKSAFGITVVDYIRQRRLAMARNALIEQGLSVGQAAYMAGYRYPSNFVTAFKKQFGMTPSELTRLHS